MASNDFSDDFDEECPPENTFALFYDPDRRVSISTVKPGCGLFERTEAALAALRGLSAEQPCPVPADDDPWWQQESTDEPAPYVWVEPPPEETNVLCELGAWKDCFGTKRFVHGRYVEVNGERFYDCPEDTNRMNHTG